MSFSLELTAGAVQSIYSGALNFKPYLQITDLHKMSVAHGDRFKITLSDSLHSMRAVLSPKLNTLVQLGKITALSIVKLLEWNMHCIKNKKVLVILNLEDIATTCPTMIGLPTSIESQQTKSPMQPTKPKKTSTKAMVSLTLDLVKLYNSPELSDITFVCCDGTRFFAHKCLLVTRSQYFRSLLMNGMKESHQHSIHIHDCSSQVFGSVLRYIYTDQFPLKEEDEPTLSSSVSIPSCGHTYCTEALCAEDTDGVWLWKLWKAGNYYGLEGLCTQAERLLVLQQNNKADALDQDFAGYLSVSNVCARWNVARTLGSSRVEQHCASFFSHNFESIFAGEGYLTMRSDCLSIAVTGILQSQPQEKKQKNEELVSNALWKWGWANLVKDNTTFPTHQQLLDLFPGAPIAPPILLEITPPDCTYDISCIVDFPCVNMDVTIEDDCEEDEEDADVDASITPQTRSRKRLIPDDDTTISFLRFSKVR